MRIVFMGTPEFAVPSLHALVDAGYPPDAVVTAPDRPRGRGQKLSPTAVKKAAKKLGIDKIIQPESVKSDVFAEAIKQLRVDIMVVVAFKILPPQVYEQASIGAFNLHASLLPKYRGAAPINWALMRGESTTGVTTFQLQHRVDRGAILMRKAVDIGPNDTAGDVHDRLKELGAEVVVETVQKLESGNIDPTPQSDEEATTAPKIFSDDCQIPWFCSAEEVHNHIRGLSPYPGAWTMHGETRLKVYKSKKLPVTDDSAGVPGEVISADDQLIVACGEGAIQILKLQQPGRKALKSRPFLRGYDLHGGSVLK